MSGASDESQTGARPPSRIFVNSELKAGGLVVLQPLGSRDRLARRHAADPVAARDRADLEIGVAGLLLLILAGEAVRLERSQRHQRLVGALIGPDYAKTSRSRRCR